MAIGIFIGNSVGNKKSSSYWTQLWNSLVSATVTDADRTKVVLTFSKADEKLAASDFTIKDKEAFVHNMSDYAFGLYNLKQAVCLNNKTYFTYHGPDDNPYITYYDHLTKSFATPVMIGTNPLVNGDGHGQPALFIDSTGYIHLVWGAHLTAFQYSKSTNPEDIAAWTPMTSPGNGTYPQFVQLSDGTIYLFYRDTSTPRKWGYKTTTNGGTTWSAYTTMTTEFSYGLFKKGVGDVIHGVFLGYPQTAEYTRCNIYYMKYAGGWKNIDGDSLTLVVDHTSDILVYDSGAKYTPAVAYDFDSSNNPYLLFTEGTDETGTYNYKFAKYSAGAWVITDLGVSTSHWRDFASSLKCISALSLETYLVTGGTTASIGGNIEKWGTSDGGATWAKIASIKEDGRQYIDPILVNDYNSEAKLLFSQFRNFPCSWISQGYLYGDSGFLLNASRTVNSLARDVTNKILTLTLSAPIVETDVLQVGIKSLSLKNVTNNISPYPSGLLNYFQMDEPSGNMLDIISSNTGTVVGVTQNVTGKIGKCYSFDGNDKVTLGTSHTFLTTQSFSIAFWVKCNAVNVTGYMMDRHDTGANSRIAILQINAGLLFAIRGVSDGTQCTYTWPNILTTDWMFIVAIRNVADDKLYLYVNGVADVNPITDTSASNIGPLNLRLGLRMVGDQGFVGLMDSLGIWPRVLTQLEINVLYNSGLGRVYPI